MTEQFWGFVTDTDKVHVFVVDESTSRGMNQVKQQPHVVKILPKFYAEDHDDAERIGYDLLITERTEALERLKNVRSLLG